MAGIHVRQYFFPSLRGFGILSAHATISVIVIGFTIAKFCIQTQRDFLRREAFPVPEYSVDLILKDGPCDSLPQPGSQLLLPRVRRCRYKRKCYIADGISRDLENSVASGAPPNACIIIPKRGLRGDAGDLPHGRGRSQARLPFSNAGEAPRHYAADLKGWSSPYNSSIRRCLCSYSRCSASVAPRVSSCFLMS
jgi:hypothetical protein